MSAGEPLWRLREFVAAAGGELEGEAGDISGISIDSRTIKAGDAFFAIAGERFDGHDFVNDALGKGAAIAVVDAARAKEFDGRPLLCVDDVLEALRQVARAARARSDAQILAITGSVGKTGSKELARVAFGATGPTHASAASYNNHWGVPLSLARLGEEARYAIFEVGMNHAGEITPLTRMVRPHIALITTVAPVHLGYFESVDAIAAAKAEIFAGLEKGGTAILNRDNSYFDYLKEQAELAGAGRVIAFGTHEQADARLLHASFQENLSSVEADICGTKAAYKIGSPGRHIVMNSLAVLAAVHAAGADLAHAAMALAQWSAPDGRGKKHVLEAPGGAIILIDESYNANPASMAAAIETLGNTTPQGRGRRIAVLGDMLELGETSAELHAALSEKLAQSGVDLVYTAGPMMAHLAKALPAHLRARHVETAQELEQVLLRDVQGRDIVMIKGSLGSKMGPLVDLLRSHFQRAPA